MTTANRIAAVALIVWIVEASGSVVRGADAGVAVDCSGAAVAPQEPADETEGKAGKGLMLKVTDAVGLGPLAGAAVWVRSTSGKHQTWEGTTDSQGRYEIIPRDDAPPFFDFVIAADGYVRCHGSFAIYKASVHTISLKPTEAIGGMVRDEKGRPIEGVRVVPIFHQFSHIWSEIYTSPNSGRAISTTDAQGRWRSNALPVGTNAQDEFWLLVTHAEHATSMLRVRAGEARAFATVQVMKAGVAISGTVLSPFGRPVAEVVVSSLPRDRPFLRLTTDKDGRFHSGRCVDPDRPGLVLLVQASGLAWAVHHVVAHQGAIPPQVIKLSGRRPLEGRVVDAKGEPVRGAFVSSSRDLFGGLIEWQTKTDANGQFVWHDAPTTGKLYLDVFKPALVMTSEVIGRPTVREITITMDRGGQ